MPASIFFHQLDDEHFLIWNGALRNGDHYLLREFTGNPFRLLKSKQYRKFQSLRSRSSRGFPIPDTEPKLTDIVADPGVIFNVKYIVWKIR